MRKSTLFWGIILLAIGLLLLFSNLGIIVIETWSAIWAVLLVVVGLAILWSAVSGPGPQGDEVTIPRDGADRARIRLRHGAGRLRIGAGAGPDMLLEGRFAGGVSYRTRHRGGELDVDVSPPDLLRFIAPWNWGREGMGWLVRFNDAIPLSLSVETGASDARLDLSQLLVADLDLEAGASSLRVKMPARGEHTKARIEAGAASVSVDIPPGAAARLRLDTGLASVQVDETRFPRTGRFFQSPDYEDAEYKIDLNVEAGVGSLTVR